MNKVIVLSILISVLAMTPLLDHKALAPGPTMCTGVITGTISGPVMVPAGATCTIAGPATVTGSVFVGSGAFLVVSAGVTITGSVISNGAFAVFLLLATVGQNVQITGTTSGTLLDSVTVGNVAITSQTGGFISLKANTVTGSVIDNNNITTFPLPGTGSHDIRDNAISSNLICNNNTPAPVNPDSSNTVGGNRLGQCASLP